MNKLNRTVCGAAAILAAPALALAASTFTAPIIPTNNSGVTGSVTLSLNADQLTVAIHATGLEPDQVHPQHIHGFANGQDSRPPVPADDTNKNGLIDDVEAEAAAGPPIVFLTLTPGGNTTSDFPTAPNGTIDYSQTFTVSPTLIQPLQNRLIEIHGRTVNGTYNPLLPVAGADLSAALVAVPLPAAALPGLALLTTLALLRSRSRRAPQH
jgi:hypothetical protein